MTEQIELPPTDPALAAIRMATTAFLLTMGRRKGERYLRALATVLANEEMVHPLIPTRPKSERAEQLRAQRQAAAWLRQVLPELIRSLPPA